MGDASIQHVDREVVGGIASTALGHEGEIPHSVEARAREGLARKSQIGSGDNQTHEERSRYTSKGRPHLWRRSQLFSSGSIAGTGYSCSRRLRSSAAALAAKTSSTEREGGVISAARPFTKLFGDASASSTTCSGDVEVITIEFASASIGASPCE